MWPRLLLLSLAVGAGAFPGAAQSAKAVRAKPLRVHSLEPTGQWGAALSPDGRTVALAILRKGLWGDYQREDDFVDAEVWDFRAKRRLARRNLSHRPAVAITTAEWGQVRYTADGQVLLIYDGELLHVLKPETLEEITRIDLGLPALPREAEVVDLAVPRDHRRQIAVLVSRGGGRGGAVRVYNLETGELQRHWEYDRGYPEFGGRLAWHPDGKKLAVTLLPILPGHRLPREEKNLEVLDVESGKVLARLNTGYLAGPVVFSADNRLLTATAQPGWTQTFGPHPVRVWDASTGRLIREINGGPAGVRGSLELSADARRLLGYVGLEPGEGPRSDPETSFEIREQRFRLWDLAGGTVIASSPPLQPNAGKRAQLRLSAKGNLVLVYWKYADKPVLVYEIP